MTRLSGLWALGFGPEPDDQMTRFTLVAMVSLVVASPARVVPPAGNLLRAGAAGERQPTPEWSVAEKPILQLQETMRAGKMTSEGLVAAYVEKHPEYADLILR